MTSEESFARLDAIRAEKYPYEERDREEWRANADNPKKRAEITRFSNLGYTLKIPQK